MMKALQYLFQAAGVTVLLGMAFYLASIQLDDTAMATFKQSLASFVKSDKQAAPVREILGADGDKICMAYPYGMESKDNKTVKHQLSRMFPARAGDIEKLGNAGKESELVVGILNNENLIVLTGNRGLIVDGNARTLAVEKDKMILRKEGFGCFNYATAKFSKSENYLLLSGVSSGGLKTPVVEKKVATKPRPKKAALPAEKKISKPVRSYGY
jgi:hypothetical protein